MSAAAATLTQALAPERLAFFFHFAKITDRKITSQFCGALERAVVTSSIKNAAYCRDCITAWCVLRTQLPAADNTWMRTYAVPASAVDPAPKQLEQLVRNASSAAKLTIHEVSAIRYILCQRLGAATFRCIQPAAAPAITARHEERLAALMTAYSKDCTFRATGDWMIDAKTTLLCPPQLTAVVSGADAPYEVASHVHGAELNDLLRPIIRTPVQEQVETALSDPSNESIDAFVTLATIFTELVPGAPIALNSGIFQRGADQPPTLFLTSNCPLIPGLPGSSYGVIIGTTVVVYNGRSILRAILECLYAIRIWGFQPADDAHQFVYNSDCMGDANPLAKYARHDLDA